MGIRESLLNTITSVGNGDFVRIVTSAGASSKATLANVFKSFESGLGAKSNLGTSDYVRVVGSDNNSYKQTISSVADVIGCARAKGTLGANTDLNTVTTPSTYQLTGTYVNMPSGFTAMWGQLAVIKGGGSYVTQIFFRVNGGVYIRSLDNGTWTDWEHQPTRAEINTLNSKTEGVTRLYRWNNVSRFDIQLSAVPSTNKYGQLILFNSNQRVLAFIDIDDAPSALPISGGITFTVTVSGTTLSVVASSVLWGATLGILQF